MTTAEIRKMKAFFKKHLEDYFERYSAVPTGGRLASDNLSRCCGAQFFHGLSILYSYPQHVLANKHKRDKSFPNIYDIKDANQYNSVMAYCGAQLLKLTARETTNYRPFLSCITASFQVNVMAALRKAGWKKVNSQPVKGSGSNTLTMWTKDAREWEKMGK